MLVQTRTIKVQSGYADKIVERFSQGGPVTKREGFIDLTVMVNRKKQDHDEVMVMIRWESVEAWKNWEKSDEHIQGHREKRGQSKPDYLIDMNVSMYEVQAVKEKE